MVNVALNLLAGLYLLTAVIAEEPTAEDKIPNCAQTCFDDASRDSGCDVSNAACLCPKTEFILSVQDCLQNTCVALENLVKGLEALNDMCGQASGITDTFSQSKSHTAETTSVTNSTQISTTPSPSSILSSVSQSTSKPKSSVSSSNPLNTETTSSTTSLIDSTTMTNSVPVRTPPPATGTALDPSTTVVLSTPNTPIPSFSAAHTIMSVPCRGWLGGVMVMLGIAVI